jgi:hypothetical protein
MPTSPQLELSIYDVICSASGGERPVPHLMSKGALLRLSRVIENEIAGGPGSQGVLVGSFQRELFFRQSERRWHRLASHVGRAIVLAAFAEAKQNGSILEIPIARQDPIGSEWSIVYYQSSSNAVALAAREMSLNGERLFETSLVRSAPVVLRTVQLCSRYVKDTHPTASEWLSPSGAGNDQDAQDRVRPIRPDGLSGVTSKD